MPRSRITRTALGCSGLGWLPALAALDRAAGQLLGERLGHLRARAVAGAQEQHARRAPAALAPGACAARQRKARVQRRAGARQQLAAARQVEDVVGVAAVGGAAPHRDKATVAQLAQVVGDQALAPARQRAQLADAPIAARQLAQQPPPQRVPRQPQEPRRRALAVFRRGDTRGEYIKSV